MHSNNISKQRILGEAKKLSQEKLTILNAGPLSDNLYTWHFTIQGPQNTEFHEGIYHGQILLPYQYPFKPPDIVFMNKNGRFQTNTKICLTITQYHPQEWNSAWTIRTMLEANIAGIGALASTPDVRTHLAKASHSYVCQKCGPIKQILAPRPPKGNIRPPILQKPVQLAENKVEELNIQRKFSEGHKPQLNPNIWFQKPFSVKPADQNLRRIQKKPQYKPRQIIKPIHETEQFKQSQSYDGQEVVYITVKNPYASNNRLKHTVHQILSNSKKLKQIEASMQWVD